MKKLTTLQNLKTRKAFFQRNDKIKFRMDRYDAVRDAGDMQILKLVGWPNHFSSLQAIKGTLKEHYVVASRNKVQLYKHYMRMLDFFVTIYLETVFYDC